jgi:uncharacterized circularly permuted ATP-grasp superfamily protein/uncharacterized alpha-E superfamily protein
MTNMAPSLQEGPPSLIGTYDAKGSGGYDELLDANGAIRPHWRELFNALEELPAGERTSRNARIDHRVRETGIAYDMFADPSSPAQKWQLDLMPIVFSSGEWRWLAAALVQRARVFDKLLADLYGDQKLMRDGIVPPELVFSDNAYLRPCHGLLNRAGPLQFYAADVARGADGKWRVIDNHLETLAGIGFTLANRVAHTHVTGDLFKRVNAVRLASHFQRLQMSLAAHAGRDNAAMALLTPGPQHEDYFSHAYFARYLGLLLVEGSDLRTRGSHVYLKTLEGLREVDLIIRCVDGRQIDPLELDPSGFKGPAGLLRVNREHPRLVANAIGTAVAQNRGLGPYLPKLAKHLLGEELSLLDAPRWWLGDADARRHVLDNLDRVVIRSAQEGTGRPGQAALGQAPGEASAVERERLKAEIGLHGARLVAEEKIGFSTAPSFGPQGLEARPFAVRFYVAFTGEGFEVMPGGLAMTVDPARAVALSAADGHTRDVWVLSDAQQAPHVSLWRPRLELARIERPQRLVQSRVADDLYWLGRYSERADWTMRMLRGALRRVAEDSGPADGIDAVRRCLEMRLTDPEDGPMLSFATPSSIDIDTLCANLVSRSRGPRTLVRTLEGLYQVSYLVRDRLSHEAWQTLSRFRPGDQWMTQLAATAPNALLDPLDEGLAALSSFNGLTHENMTRNYGWSFLDMGRRLERAYNLSESILTLFIPPPDPEAETSSLRLLLELADSFITYRSRYRLDPMLPLVLDLLLLDEANPRSLAYQLAAISKHLEALPDARQGVSLTEDRRLILTLLTSTRLADVVAIAEEADRATLERLMREQLDVLPELSNAVARRYFNLTEETPHRVLTRSEPRP